MTGSRPRSDTTKPATVSYGPSGSVMPVSSAKSSMFMSPSTVTEPSGPSRADADAPGSTVSYSSRISPMSSSTRSSIVTMPAVPPYSSATMARWARWRRISVRVQSTPFVPGNRAASRASSPTRMDRWATWGSRRSRTCTKPMTSSAEPRMTGYRLCGRSTVSRTAFETGVAASRKATSVRGTMTSRSSRSPAANTSSMSSRSSMVSSSCAATSPRSSSPVIASRPCLGSIPSTRTTAFVERESRAMKGRKRRATRSMGAATKSATGSARWSAMRFGTSSPRTRET